MAQRHLDPTDPTGEALAGYLRAQATEFLRALRLHRETGGATGNGTEDPVDAARALRRSVRRISASLHTFRPLLEPDWSESLQPELAWLSGTLAMEHAYAARQERLLLALHRLSGATAFPTQVATAAVGATVEAVAGSRADVAAGNRAARATPVPMKAAPGAAGPPTPTPTTDRGNLTVGAAKAGALLERQLTLARTRAHSTALQALGSSRFHAVADKIAVLASEVPLTPTAPTTPLHTLATAAEDRLTDAVTALPLVTAGNPYNAEALIHGLSPDPSPHPQDAPWHQVRLLLRLHRYAREALHGNGGPTDLRLLTAGQALDRHRDASEAAAAAASAARTPRIAPATAYALGVLHADQRHEVEAARFAFQQCWQKQALRTP
ncbi:MAG: CHAD domain-containing protein [Streptomyces sp.]|nr:CHAD domain-containing protein [Streptomyces sp.]